MGIYFFFLMFYFFFNFTILYWFCYISACSMHDAGCLGLVHWIFTSMWYIPKSSISVKKKKDRWLIYSFNVKKWSEVKSFSHVRIFVTPWIVAYQAPPSMGFSRQEYGSGLSFPSSRDLPYTGIEPRSPCTAGRRFTIWTTKETRECIFIKSNKQWLLWLYQ